MKQYFTSVRGFLLIGIVLLAMSCSRRSGNPRILVFTKTSGYHHESIPEGVAAVQKLGSQNKFDVDTTSNAEWFNEDSLQKYAAVVFMSTTGDVLNHYQEAEFERYIQSGGGFVGIHAASDAEYDWGWYGRLLGGYFLTHPGIRDSFPNVQPGTLQVVNKDHASTKDLPEQWKRTDEFYSFKKLDSSINVLLKVDENSFKGGYNGANHPMAWYHDYDGGRAWYTNLGHTKETFTEDLFLKHLLGGIQYAIGNNKELNYSNAKTGKVPEENRFAKTGLVSGQLFEPTEMAILPNLDILVAQRRGEIMLYKQGDSVLKQAGFLNVYWKTSTPGVNAEEGVLGLKADPNFSKNNFVFIFYSPVDSSVNRLSRFRFVNDKIDMGSEKVILDVKSDREICCHTGGSIAFDKDGLLYVSTGDNSTPFNEPKQPHPNSGFAPIDDRPGHQQYDARRSSGNPNDLRGKILRIRVKDDGSYEIPEGNLYAKGQQGSRPEIYVQGNRNPYRISIDQKTNYLYWGEVGPDASRDSLGLRGPRGYDEVNQARKAGFFGWPLFIGDNYAYREFDFESGKAGNYFDPAKPINASHNNTGLKNLPPAQPAFIWYPYDVSPDFPQVGTGGRNAMAGPVYYTDMFPKESRLPDYYNGKLFIYDWIRGWIKAVSMKPNGDFDKMEPFMQQTKLANCIDMEVGPDGKLYLLEYGTGWFTKNPDAGLSRIDYNGGNRAPLVAGITVDKTSGALPFKVVAQVEAKDLEKDAITYEWHFGNATRETKEPRLEHTFTAIGDYPIYVVAKDAKGATTKSSPVQVYAGNEAPVVNITIAGNKSFYFPGTPVSYAVNVLDKDDPSVAGDLANVFVSADYVEGLDKAGASMGHQVMSEAMAGRSLIQSLDCKGCHKEAEKSIGPAYTAVSQRYQKNNGATTHLVNKIIKGGAGVWGETAMPAHPNLSQGDARQMVSYIMSLANEQQKQKSLPAKGTLQATLNKKPTENGVLVLSATYGDKGGPGVKPQIGNASLALRSNRVSMSAARNLKGFTLQSFGGRQFVKVPKGQASFSLDSIDLAGIEGVEFTLAGQTPPKHSYSFELRLDGPNGKKIGEGQLPAGTKFVTGEGGFGRTTIMLNLEPVTDGKFHNLYIVSNTTNADEEGSLILAELQFKARKTQGNLVRK
ncbi:PKD domain-containing protein [Segetibacter sp. 3557_3]|uniref:ThuA domain-containing protein n=1 Tax=Segetibacter sp. 3557_3 TaxID=2547429 RepID=UPI00105869E0|nr:ThuA domain-containing protein [Segetibacter sp. 3557_3]TDH28902.1 PKD domain-containing protein [Segetibacter sp. 3557_3]